MTVKLAKKENLYFALKIVFTIVVLIAAIACIDYFRNSPLTMATSLAVFVVYAIVLWLFVMFQKPYLAAGKGLYRQVNPASFMEDAKENRTVSVRFMGLFMSRPYLPRRIANLTKE